MSLRGSRHRRFGIIWRYLLREFLFSFCIAFLFFFFIFFVNQLLLLAEEILSKRVPVWTVVRLIVYSLPAILAFTFPFSSLLGALMALGRLASDNEISAFRAGGVSQRTLFIPVLCLGALLSGMSFFTNDYLLPRGTVEFAKLYRDVLYANPSLELESNSVRRYQDIILSTGEVEGNSISDLMILDRDSTNSSRMISAESAVLEKSRRESAYIRLKMRKVFGHTVDEARGAYDYFSADQMDYNILLSSFSFNIQSLSPREMSTRHVWEKIVEMERGFEKEKELYRERLREAEGEEYERLSRRPPFDRSLQLYRIEFHKKISIPFACFAFMFFAFPAGMRANRSGRWLGFGIGLLVSLLYWALLFAGQTLGLRFRFPPALAMWMPNCVILSLGVILYVLRRNQ